MIFRPLERIVSQGRPLVWMMIFVLMVGVSLVWSSNRANAVFPDDYNNSYTYDVVVNDKGWSAWVRNDLETGFGDIFLDNGHEVIQLSDTKYDHEDTPEISDNAVVWAQRITGHDTKIPEDEIPDSEIYLYRGGKIVRISGNDQGGVLPKVNDEGTVVWLRGLQIMLHKGGQTRQIGNNYNGGGWLALNEDGWVAWLGSGASPGSVEVFLYNGIETIQITNDNVSHKFDPKLSDNGQIVWSKLNELYLYDGGNTIKLHTSPDEIMEYVIGDKAVAWAAFDGEGDKEIYLYNGVETTQLTDNSLADWGPEINERGWITWVGFDGNDDEIFLWDGAKVIQMTDNLVQDTDPKINNIGWDSGVSGGSALASGLSAGRDGRTAATGVWGDNTPPHVKLESPFVSTKISKTPRFKVRWSAFDPSPLLWQRAGGIRRMGSSGIKSYSVYYRPSTSRKWRIWKKDITAKQTYFTGKAGVTYYFRVRAQDNAGNYSWSKVRKTIIPFNEGMSLIRKIGFRGYLKSSKSPFFLSSVRYSQTRGNTLVYKLYNTNGIGLVTTKGPDRGRAKIYVDGKYVKTIDAHKSSLRPRQLLFYRGYKKKGTHWLKVVNLGTPGRSRFDVDGVVVAR